MNHCYLRLLIGSLAWGPDRDLCGAYVAAVCTVDLRLSTACIVSRIISSADARCSDPSFLEISNPFF